MAADTKPSSPIEVVREYVKDGKKIPATLRDLLLFGALVELYDKTADQGTEIKKMKPWVEAGKWILLTVAPLVLILLFSMLTHQFSWPFPPN